MLDPALGRFDAVMAMDSLIHYRADDIARALAGLLVRADRVVFTVAPRTPMLSAMHLAGKLFPRSDRSPAIIPHTPARIAAALRTAGGDGRLAHVARVSSGFYISQALELTK
jgi:magnesium-protoporphyrin O-methyltransferase